MGSCSWTQAALAIIHVHTDSLEILFYRKMMETLTGPRGYHHRECSHRTSLLPRHLTTPCSLTPCLTYPDVRAFCYELASHLHCREQPSLHQFPCVHSTFLCMLWCKIISSTEWYKQEYQHRLRQLSTWHLHLDFVQYIRCSIIRILGMLHLLPRTRSKTWYLLNSSQDEQLQSLSIPDLFRMSYRLLVLHYLILSMFGTLNYPYLRYHKDEY